jgi:hypothetical protein
MAKAKYGDLEFRVTFEVFRRGGKVPLSVRTVVGDDPHEVVEGMAALLNGEIDSSKLPKEGLDLRNVRHRRRT